MSVNWEGSRNIFEGALRCASLKRLVFFSTIAVYDESQPHTQTAETVECNPIGDYGLSKQLAEQDALRLCAERGLPVAILRFAPIYGLEKLADLEKRIKGPGGIYFLIGSGGARLSLCSIANVPRAVDTALQNAAMIGQTCNVADVRAYSRQEILETYARARQKPRWIVRVPVGLLRWAVNVLSSVRPSHKRVYQSYLHKLASDAVFDTRKIVALGYRAEESLASTLLPRGV
jgi:nucleoside-diphosphate-sugar epimerase